MCKERIPEISTSVGVERKTKSSTVFFTNPKLPISSRLKTAKSFVDFRRTFTLTVGIDPATIDGSYLKNDLTAMSPWWFRVMRRSFRHHRETLYSRQDSTSLVESSRLVPASRIRMVLAQILFETAELNSRKGRSGSTQIV